MLKNTEKKRSAATALHVFTTLKIALNCAVKIEELITQNVTLQVASPKPKKSQPNVPNEKELKEIIAVADQTSLKNVVRLAAATGMRRGELVALRWDNVDLDDMDEGRVRVVDAAVRVRGKGQTIGDPKSEESKRMIPIDANTTVMLRTHLAQQNEYMLSLGEVYKNQNFVFANLISNMLDLDHVSQGFKRITVKAGHPKARLHDLRHYNASRLTAKGATFISVKERLGHASAAFTMNTYLHGTENDQRAAAEAMSEMFAI